MKIQFNTVWSAPMLGELLCGLDDLVKWARFLVQTKEFLLLISVK
jgi:hypothetical protein